MEFHVSFPRFAACLPDPNRYNVFNNTHKALRLGHCRMLSELGSHDFSDEAQTRSLMKKLRDQISLCLSHLQVEVREIRAALAARGPAPTLKSTGEYAGREQALAELQSLIRAVEVATPARRHGVGQSLYQRYALFAAADMAQMHDEETELLSELQSAFSDDELTAIETRIRDTIPPPMMASQLELMMPALNHIERGLLLEKLQSALPGGIAGHQGAA